MPLYESRPRRYPLDTQIIFDLQEQLRQKEGELRAVRAVITVLEQELLDALGPCFHQQDFDRGCRLHFAHAGPCDVVQR
jgi:hypothetical protein